MIAFNVIINKHCNNMNRSLKQFLILKNLHITEKNDIPQIK